MNIGILKITNAAIAVCFLLFLLISLQGCITWECVTMYDRKERVQSITAAYFGSDGVVVEYEAGLFENDNVYSLGTVKHYGIVEPYELKRISEVTDTFSIISLPKNLSLHREKLNVSLYSTRMKKASAAKAEKCIKGSRRLAESSTMNMIELPSLFYTREDEKFIYSTYLLVDTGENKPRLLHFYFPDGDSSSPGMVAKKIGILPLTIVADAITSPFQLGLYLLLEFGDLHFGF